jgi:hypothetical protein
MFGDVREGSTGGWFKTGLATPTGVMRSPVRVWLLTLVTLGLYGLQWYYTINRELRDFDPRIKVRPALALLSVSLGALLVLPAVVSIVNTGSRIAQAQRRAGLSAASVSGIRGLLLGFALGLTPLYYQHQLNQVWIARN